MKFDLHCHTNCSDGTLTPEQLLKRAISAETELLAITDHDSLAAYDVYPPGQYFFSEEHGVTEEGESAPLQLISGCEFSAIWNGVVIHVVGLDMDLESPEVKELLANQVQRRIERGERIATYFDGVGIPNSLAGARRIAGDATLGRPHFARYLVEQGVVDSEKKAFKKYLGKGKPGDIKVKWPTVPEVVKIIDSAGGLSVIAHPVKYDFTRTKLLRLADEFKEAGGDAIEVISGKQPPNEIQQLVDAANQRGLLSSAGSDFHRPGQPWADLGKIPSLPNNAQPIWQVLQDRSA